MSNSELQSTENHMVRETARAVIDKYEKGPDRFRLFEADVANKLSTYLPELGERAQHDVLQLLDVIIKSDISLAAKIADIYINAAERHKRYTTIVRNIIDRYPQLQSQEQHMVTFSDNYVSGLYDLAMQNGDYSAAHIICGSTFVKNHPSDKWKDRQQKALEGMAHQALSFDSLTKNELEDVHMLQRILLQTVFDFYRVGDEIRYEMLNVPHDAVLVAKRLCEIDLQSPDTSWKALLNAQKSFLSKYDPDFYKQVEGKNTLKEKLKVEVARFFSMFNTNKRR